MKINLKSLIVSLGLPLAAGFIGSAFTASAISTWYTFLNKPSFSPPNWIFGPVWTILYLLMGYALYLVIQTKTKKDKSVAYKVFALQLFLNTFWSLLFFGSQAIGLAFVEIIILWIVIYKNIVVFGNINKLASHLLVPYIAWVTFASVLNFAILLLN